MADSQDDLKREFEEFEQAESSLDSGLESAPRPRSGDGRSGMPGWIKWVILADFVIVAAVLLIVFAA